MSFGDYDAAGAALSEAHAIEVFVGTFVDLDTIFAGHGAEVFALCDIDGEFFVDEPDFGHGWAVFLRRQSMGERTSEEGNASPGIRAFPDAV